MLSKQENISQTHGDSRDLIIVDREKLGHVFSTEIEIQKRLRRH